MGATVYRYAVDARSDGTNFSVTEQWFWFSPEDLGYGLLDTFTMSGDIASLIMGNSAVPAAKRPIKSSGCPQVELQH